MSETMVKRDGGTIASLLSTYVGGSRGRMRRLTERFSNTWTQTGFLAGLSSTSKCEKVHVMI